MPTGSLTDTLEIRQLIEDWVLWRDTGEWDRLATTWHPGGRIVTTWCVSTGEEFVARSRGAWKAGLKVLHTLGGASVDVSGSRAIGQTKMRIIQRAAVHGVLVDVSCHGRFCDAFEKRDGRWGIVLRQPAYDMDRMSPVEPGATLTLDADLLASYPEGYRHLAYLQTQLGMTVTKDLPGTRGPETEALYARLRRWLAGEDAACLDAPDPA